METIQNQLDIAWSNLDAELQRDIAEPDDRTTVSDFINRLEAMKPVWFRIYGKGPAHPSSNATNPGLGFACPVVWSITPTGSLPR
jgi:hypothetical protein